MKRHIVCLTFDHDHLSGFIARGLTSPTAISRGEYDMVVIPRLVALLKRYDIKATFFTPGHTIDSTPEAVMPYIEAGHELAHHGWTHRLPVSLSREEEEEEIVRGNISIKRVSGQTARGYRSPAWDLSPHSIELLLKHGIRYDSSLMGHDYLPYQAREADTIELQKPAVRGKETKLIEMPISWTLDDFPVFEYMRNPNGVQAGLMNASAVLENWVDDFVYLRDNLDWGILTYTFHPHVIGRGHRMIMLEKLIRKLIELGAEFQTMESAVAAYQAQRGSRPRKTP